MSVGSASTFSSRVTCSSTPPSFTPGASSTPSSSSGTVDWIFSSSRTLRRSMWSTWPAHGVALLVLHDHGLALAAVDLDVEQRVALGQHGAQPAGVDLERHAVARRLPVDHAGHEPRRAAAGGSRATRARRAAPGSGLCGRPVPSAPEFSGWVPKPVASWPRTTTTAQSPNPAWGARRASGMRAGRRGRALRGRQGDELVRSKDARKERMDDVALSRPSGWSRRSAR